MAINGNRKKSQDVLLSMFKQLDADGFDYAMLEKRIKAMSDKDYDQFIDDLESGKAQLTLTVPIGSNDAFTMEHIFAVAEKFHHNFFERIWVDKGDGSPPYLSNFPYFVIDAPVRRQSQHLSKKMSVPRDNSTIDHLTGQVTGPSKGSSISGPEANVAVSLGMINNIVEMMKVRGGDAKSLNAMNREMSQRGGASQEEIFKVGGKVKATQTLQTFLTCMHLKSTLTES